MVVPDGEWKLTCSAEQFSQFRDDKEFAFLVTLARAVNALKFGIAAANNTPPIATPENDRQRFGAVPFIAGLLHEMREFRHSQWEEWSGLSAFHSVFELLADEALDPDTLKLLNQIRNRAAFHLDPTVASRTLPRLPAEQMSFTAGIGKKRMSANNELADIVTFAFIFGHPNDVHKMYSRFAKFFDDLRALAVRFVERADRVLMTRLRERGFRMEERSDGSYAAEAGDGNNP